MISIIAAAVITMTGIAETNACVWGNGLTATESNSMTVGVGDRYKIVNAVVGGSTVRITTNAISTVVVTNTVVTDNSESWGWSSQSWIQQGNTIIQNNPDKPATERTETTIITEVKTLTLKWDGKPYTVKRERVIDIIVKRFRLTPSAWEEIK